MESKKSNAGSHLRGRLDRRHFDVLRMVKYSGFLECKCCRNFTGVKEREIHCVVIGVCGFYPEKSHDKNSVGCGVGFEITADISLVQDLIKRMNEE